MKQSSSPPRGVHSDGSREPSGLMATIQELQNELAAQRKLAASAGSMQWEFIRHIGHEIRNPMTAIIGMTDLALLTELTDEQRECLATVQRAAKGLMHVLNNVQDYARLQAGTLELEWSGFRLRNCLKESLGKFAPQAETKGLELLCRVAPETPDAIVGDVRRLAQVLEHLLANALVNTPQGEISLEVDVIQEDEKEVGLRFQVRDTGIGMSLEDCKRVGTAWTRPRSTDPRTRSGAGLGLPMVVGLAQLFGGKFSIHSQNGQGTQCEFTASFLKQSSREQPAPPAQAADSTLANRKVLIVVASDTSRRWLTESCQRMAIKPMVSEPSMAAAQSCLAQSSCWPELALVDAALLASGDSAHDASSPSGSLPIPKVLIRWPPRAEAADNVPQGEQVLATVSKPVFDDELREAFVTAFSQLGASAESRADDASNLLQAQEPTMHCEPQEAMARLGGDRELYGDIVRRFSEDAHAVLEKLRNHVEADNGDALHRTAHSFKGLAAMCGAVGVVATAGQLEAQAKAGNLDDAARLLDQLSQDIERARSELAEYT